MFEKLGGRKLVASILTVLIGLGAVAIKGDVPVNFLDLLIAVLITFVGGNGVEHIALAYKARHGAVVPSAPPAEPASDPEVIKGISELADRVELQGKAITNLSQIILTALGATNNVSPPPANR